MSKRLLLLRHGQTVWNSEGRWQGRIDIPLDDTGRVQAKAAAEALAAAYAPQILVASPLTRAAETAQIVGERLGLAPTFEPGLGELAAGEFEGLTRAEVHERYGEGPHDLSRYGGESDAEIGIRMLAATENVMAGVPEGGTALVVSHGGVLRVLIRKLLGWPDEIAPTLGTIENCAWTELVAGVSGFHGAAPWRLNGYNRTA